jgi:hypothetical protein
MLYKRGYDDELHWDQLLNSQEIVKSQILRVMICMSYKWLYLVLSMCDYMA